MTRAILLSPLLVGHPCPLKFGHVHRRFGPSYSVTGRSCVRRVIFDGFPAGNLEFVAVKPVRNMFILVFGAMAVTKPYKFIRAGAMSVTKPYKFIGFGAIAVTKTYKFIGFVAMISADRQPPRMKRGVSSPPG
jgi:hypothetical protein